MADITVANFRANFPEFASNTAYPDSQVQFYLDLGYLLTANAYRWGQLRPFGVQLWTAHNLSIEFAAQKAAAAGQAPGPIQGPVSSGTVDKVSYARDNAGAMLPGAGHWNLSQYGLRYKYLVNMVGAGPVLVGLPGASPGEAEGAWPGPWQPLFPNPSG